MDFGAIGGTVYVLFFFVIAWAVCELNLLFLKVAIEVKSSNSSDRSHFVLTISTFFFISKAWARKICVFGLGGLRL